MFTKITNYSETALKLSTGLSVAEISMFKAFKNNAFNAVIAYFKPVSAKGNQVSEQKLILDLAGQMKNIKMSVSGLKLSKRDFNTLHYAGVVLNIVEQLSTRRQVPDVVYQNLNKTAELLVELFRRLDILQCGVEQQSISKQDLLIELEFLKVNILEHLDDELNFLNNEQLLTKNPAKHILKELQKIVKQLQVTPKSLTQPEAMPVKSGLQKMFKNVRDAVAL